MKYCTIRPHIEILNTSVGIGKLDLSPFVLRATTTKSIIGQAGTFQVELIPSMTEQLPSFNSLMALSFLERAISKNDIISIGFKKKHTFLGRVEVITKTRSISERSAQVALVLTGRDFGGLLLDDDITFAPELASNTHAQDLLGKERTQFLGIMRGLDQKGTNVFYGKHPLIAITWIMMNMPSMKIELDYKNYDGNGNLQEVESKSLGEFFCTDYTAYDNQELYDAITLTQYAGKVWNYMAKTLDPIFYDMYVETTTFNPDNPDQKFDMPRPCLVVRPKPFDRTKQKKIGKVRHYNFTDFVITKQKIGDFESTMPSLTPLSSGTVLNWVWDAHNSDNNDYLTRVGQNNYHTIPQEEVYDEAASTTILESYNFYNMRANTDILSGTRLEVYGLLFPLIDAFSIRKYGMRKLEAITNLGKVELVQNPNNIDPNILGGMSKEEKDETKYMALPDQYVELRDKLFYWFRYNPVLISGQKKVLGNDDYRIGDKVYFPNEIIKSRFQGAYYHIDGVQHQWEGSEGNNYFFTTLALSRGENPDLIAEYDQLAKYDLYDSGNKAESNIIQIDLNQESEGTSEGQKDPKTTDNIPLKIDDTAGKEDVKGNKTLTKASMEEIRRGVKQYKEKWSDFGISDPDEAVKNIQNAGAHYGVDPNIITGIISTESGFNPYAVSATGCSGLGQFDMPTAKSMKEFKDVINLGAKIVKQGVHSIKYDNDARFYPISSIWAIPECLRTKGYETNNPASWKQAIKNYIGPESYTIKYNAIHSLDPNTKLPE